MQWYEITATPLLAKQKPAEMEKYLTTHEKIQHLISKACGKTKLTQQANALSALLEAIKQTELLSDVGNRTHYLNEIASACEELKFIDKCIEVSNQACELAQTISCSSTKVSEFSRLGSRYIRLGFLEQGTNLLNDAVQLAKAAEDSDERDFALCDVALAYGDVGQIDLALELATQVEDEIRAVSHVMLPLAWDAFRAGEHEYVQRFVKAARNAGHEALMQEITHGNYQ